MNMPIKPLDPLDGAVGASHLFRDWLRGELVAGFLAPEHGDAGRELEAAIAGSGGSSGMEIGPSPLFDSPWVAGWAEAHAGDFPDDRDRDRFAGRLPLSSAEKRMLW